MVQFVVKRVFIIPEQLLPVPMIIFMIASQYFIGALSIEQYGNAMLAGQFIHIELRHDAGRLKRLFLVVTYFFKIMNNPVGIGLNRMVVRGKMIGYFFYPARFILFEPGKDGR